MMERDKDKLKILIKAILLFEKKHLTSKQLSCIINEYSWGMKSCVDSRTIGKLLQYELKKSENHFMDCIKYEENNRWRVYYI